MDGSGIQAGGIAALLGPDGALPAGRLPEAVRRAGPVVALDVFDTLVERVIRPEHVKILACDRLARLAGLEGADAAALYARRARIEAALCRAALAEAGESEFRHAEMALALHQELRAEGLLPHMPDADAFCALALRAEMAVERQVLRAKPAALEALRAARATGRRVLLISDFYLPRAALASLLEDCGIAPPLYEALHVSCESWASKRSGRLYGMVLADAGCAAGEVTMFGDNPHSDHAMARARGLDAVLVGDPARAAFYASEPADVTRRAPLRAALRRLAEDPGAPSAHLRQAVPALLLFAERLHRAARRRGLAHLFFLAREGQVLREAFEAHQDALGLRGEERIATHYVLASRRACYAASLRPLEEEDFTALFAQYRRISARDFLRSLGIDGHAADGLLAPLGAAAQEVQPDFPSSDAFRILRADSLFANAYEVRRTTQRDLLRDYVASFGVDLRAHPLALVDCGWKGSIQDFFRASLPPEIGVEGFYLGLLCIGQDVSAKQGVLFSNLGGPSPGFFTFAENRSLFEVLLCADHGSTAFYAREEDGRAAPVLEDDPTERAFIDQVAMPVARDALACFRELAALRAMTALPEAAWARAVERIHASLVFRPWLPAAAWLAAARHREGFGVFHLSAMTRPPAASPLQRMRFLARLLRRPRTVLGDAFWPAAMLHAQGGRLLVAAYRLARRLRGGPLGPRGRAR